MEYNLPIKTSKPKETNWKCPICHKVNVGWKGMYCDNCRQDIEKIKKHQENLREKRKYLPGEKITSLDELLKQDYVFWFGTTRHIEVIKSLQLRIILRFLESGHFYQAVKKGENK